MLNHDFTPLYDQYPGVIAQMPATFTSHQFILRLAQQSLPQYIEALYAYRKELRSGKPAPFMMVHAILEATLPTTLTSSSRRPAASPARTSSATPTPARSGAASKDGPRARPRTTNQLDNAQRRLPQLC